VRIVAATHRNLEEMVSEGKFREDLLYRLNVLPISIPALDHRSEDIPELLAHFADVFGTGGEQIMFTKRSLLLLQAYSWPGNVRELANFVQRFSVLYPGKTIEIPQVPDEFLTKELIELNRRYEMSTNNESLEEGADFSSSDAITADNPLLDQSLSEDDIEGRDKHITHLYKNDFEQIIELSNSISAIPAEGVPTKDLLNNLEANLIRTALDQTDGNVSKASDLLQLGRTSLIQKITKYQLGKDQ
jgi:sigma-54 specific flagellar transcriptional regulator A